MSEEASLSSLAVEKLTLTIVPQMLHGKDIKESSSKMSAKSTGTPNVWGMTNHDSCNIGPQSRMFLRCARQINSCCVGFTARNSCCFLHASQIAPLSIEPCTGRNTFCRIPLINVRPTRCLLIIPHTLWKMISRKYNLGKKTASCPFPRHYHRITKLYLPARHPNFTLEPTHTLPFSKNLLPYRPNNTSKSSHQNFFLMYSLRRICPCDQQ